MKRRLALVLGIAMLMIVGCGGEVPEEERAAGGGERETFFRRPYPNGTYVITTFGGPSDRSAYGHKSACGPRVYGTTFYSTGAYGWGCNAKVRLTANGKCAIAKVIDNGPAAWVESKAGSRCGVGRVLDVSPAIARHLFGSSDFGWSDCRKISVERVSDSLREGPCSSSGGSWTPPPVVTGSYEGTSCKVGSSTGTCKNTQTSTCATGYKSGYCPGPSNIKCCLTSSSTAPITGEGTSCRVGSSTGTCKNTQTSTCATGYKSGYCPGPSNIKCCLGS